MYDSSSSSNYFDSGIKSISSKSMEVLNHPNISELRCASVKSRPTASRRISAAELEHLMVRQGTSTTSQFQPIPYSQVCIFFFMRKYASSNLGSLKFFFAAANYRCACKKK